MKTLSGEQQREAWVATLLRAYALGKLTPLLLARFTAGCTRAANQ